MNDSKLLKFITKYIYVPFPPVLTQEEFNNLVDTGIKENKKESLWRLAFNYNRKNKDFSKIEDYFIEVRDDYYLIELVCAVKEDLNLNKLAKKVGIIGDKDLENLGLSEYIN